MTRSLSLADDAYEDLKLFKKEGDSFSDVVRWLSKEKKKEILHSLAGVWKDKPEMDAIFKKVLEERKTAKFRY